MNGVVFIYLVVSRVCSTYGAHGIHCKRAKKAPVLQQGGDECAQTFQGIPALK